MNASWQQRGCLLTCREEVIHAFLDGELAGPMEERMEAHLVVCRVCAEIHSHYVRIKASLARLGPARDDGSVRRLRGVVDDLLAGKTWIPADLEE